MTYTNIPPAQIEQAIAELAELRELASIRLRAE